MAYYNLLKPNITNFDPLVFFGFCGRSILGYHQSSDAHVLDFLSPLLLTYHLSHVTSSSPSHALTFRLSAAASVPCANPRYSTVTCESSRTYLPNRELGGSLRLPGGPGASRSVNVNVTGCCQSVAGNVATLVPDYQRCNRCCHFSHFTYQIRSVLALCLCDFVVQPRPFKGFHSRVFKAFERLGKPRKEFGAAEGRTATERAGASESNLTNCTQKD